LSGESSTRWGIPIGGAQWTTLIDFPGVVAATLFTIGCTFRCPFCHNPELVDPDRLPDRLESATILERLRDRAGFLDGVVISGGEPTVHPGLRAFAQSVRDLGLLVKLDTNGSAPGVIEELLDAGLVDFIAMDVKAPLDRYGELTGADTDVDAIEASIVRIVGTAPDYEFRTTVAPTLAREDVLRIASRLRAAGARRFFLQAFRVPEIGLLDRTWEERAALPADELESLWDEIGSSFDDGGVRG